MCEIRCMEIKRQTKNVIERSKMKLKDALQNIQYDSSWGIWAKKIDGAFTEESEARYGQLAFENGGLLDDFEFACNGEQPHDWATSWADGGDSNDSFEDIEILIDELNN